MKRFADGEKGMTLVEVLAAITISMLIVGAVYAVFLGGVRAYQHIGIENELRSEADYVAARLMNALYAFAPDGLEAERSQENQTLRELRFIRNEQFQTNNQVGLVSRAETEQPTYQSVAIKDGKLMIDGAAVTSPAFRLDDTSFFSFRCARWQKNICRSGVLTMTFTVRDGESAAFPVQPFTVKTEFGF
ncbi:type II secretion system protein J [Geobacillus sp. C56-T2]|uniref:PulJ/GspJ family protein n=1 Tax=Geobacillus sp. C56-T2 TaxID=600773 RepID=UPI0011A04CBA|nr:prepilin-type N-terminal cleavage/methylation domain-containing protein [Geobacillus sp. C56-T2]NNV05546.1 Tfp pilus assembly protein [Geobacillus sp. MMMUD3]TWG31397.1 pilin/secretion family protein with methylation motif [Geobacillus sp. C56-T2]